MALLDFFSIFKLKLIHDLVDYSLGLCSMGISTNAGNSFVFFRFPPNAQEGRANFSLRRGHLETDTGMLTKWARAWQCWAEVAIQKNSNRIK